MNFPDSCKPFSYESKSRKGILLVHGFTSTPQSMAYLGEKFQEADLNVECPLLPGHVETWERLNEVSYRDWVQAASDALERLQKRVDKVYVLGLSMGATVSLYLAEKHPELAGLIIINHAMFFGNPLVKLLPVLRLIVKKVPAIANDIKQEGQKEIAYPVTPTSGLYELTKLAKLVQKDLTTITQPILIFKSREDHVLPIRNAPYLYEKISSADKELIWLENSYHVATMDNDKDFIIDKTLRMIGI